MRVCTWLLLAGVLAACGKDGSAGDGKITVDSDLGTLVGGLIESIGVEMEATCPCQVEKGNFESNEECLKRFSYEEDFAECATEKLKKREDREMHAALYCMIGRHRARAACVEERGCDDDELADCYREIEECPMLDPQSFTPVITECPSGSLLGR